MDADEFDRLATEVEEALAASGAPIFPGVPQLRDNRVAGALTQAQWPDDDWRWFIALAARMGSVVYFAPIRYDQLDFDGTVDEASSADGTIDDDLQDTIELARRHIGHIVYVSLGFARDGIYNSLTLRAPWMATIDDALEVVRLRRSLDYTERAGLHRTERDQAEADLRAVEQRIRGWAARLSEMRAFYIAENDEERRAVAAELMPEVGDLLATPRVGRGNINQRLNTAGIQTVNIAARLVRTDVKPRLEAEHIDRAAELGTDCASRADYRTALRKDDRDRIVKEYVRAILGFRSNKVAAAVARAAEAVWLRSH